MKTIYADFNDFAENGALPLTCAGSRAAIESLSKPLQAGEEVWLTDGELWTQAKVCNCKDGSFEAHGEWEYLDEKPPTAD